MKKRNLSILVIAILMVNGCGNNPSLSSDSNTEALNIGTVKEFIDESLEINTEEIIEETVPGFYYGQSEEIANENFGLLTQTEFEEVADERQKALGIFDEAVKKGCNFTNGSSSFKLLYYNDRVIRIDEYALDQTHIKRINYSADSAVHDITIYEPGEICKEIFFYYSDGMLEAVEYFYPNGTIAKEIYYNSDGTPDKFKETDENGNWIKSVDYDSGGEIFSYATCEWDANGNPIKMTIYNGDGTIREEKIY